MMFFVLKNPIVHNFEVATDFTPVGGTPLGDAPRCPTCEKYIGLRPMLPPLTVDLENWGSSWADISFGPTDQILVSERLVKVFSHAGQNGISSLEPATIAKIKRHRSSAAVNPPSYWVGMVSRSRAKVDDSGSGLERDGAVCCQECGLGGVIKRLQRLVLKAGTWSGEDVFFARGLPGVVIVTERFQSLCRAHGANCMFVDAEAFAFDHYPHEREDNIL
jgi:hypothetical protein